MAKKEVFEAKALSPLEEKFCKAFGDPESETYGQGTKSAVAAGYAAGTARNASWKALRRPRIKVRLKEIYSESDFSAGKVMSNLASDRLKALEKGDISSAVRCDELLGKRLKLWVDSYYQEIEKTDEEAERREVQEEGFYQLYAAWRLEQGPGPVMPDDNTRKIG